MIRPVLAALLAAAVLSGCGDPKEQYCGAVEEHQQELGEVLGEGGPDALLDALPVFRELAGEAPDDISDEWDILIEALEGLADALEAAGVDPATYDRDDPPEGLGDEEREAIDAAARRLTSERTATALAGVEQQAKDVCGTPLFI